MQRSIGWPQLTPQHCTISFQHLGAKSLPAKSQGVLNAEILPGSNFPIDAIGSSFPALHRTTGFIFFDNAAAAQVPQTVLDAVNYHLLECNVQRGGRYAKSREVDETISRARHSVAALVNAR